MSYYNTPPSSYKPQVRVEGFHLPSPETPPPAHHPQHLTQHHPPPTHHHDHNNHSRNNSMVEDLFATTHNGGNGGPNGNGSGGGPFASGGDPLFPTARKFPASNSGNFEDDLVSLGGMMNSGQGDHGRGGHGQHQQGGSGGSYHDHGAHEYGSAQRTHNIFDVSSPIPMSSSHHSQSHLAGSHTSQSHLSNLGGGGPGSQPGSLSHQGHSPAPPSTSLHDAYHTQANHHVPTHGHFNSTLPALNSSMRFENPDNMPPGSTPTPNPPQHGGGGPLTPSSPHPYHHLPNGPSVLQRHTPSPTITQPGASIGISGAGGITGLGGQGGRQRSRSRPPSVSGLGVSLPGSIANPPGGGGGVGPARTTRQRRGSSISGTSPPPIGGRPHAIVIPGRGAGNGPLSAGGQGGQNGGNGGGNGQWFNVGGGQGSSEYSLPTPDSLTSHSYSAHGHAGYMAPFSLSPPPGPPSAAQSQQQQQQGQGQQQGVVTKGSGIIDHGYLDGPSSYSSVGAPGGWPGSGNSMFGLSGHGHHGSMGSGLGGLGAGMPASPLSTTGGFGGASIGVSAVPANTAATTSISAAQTQAGSNGTAAGGTGDKQNLLANEKRRRRRESHNAVERRRRDNINEKIGELATLIPECMLEGAGPPNAKDNGASVTPPLTEDALVPHGVVPPPPASSSPTNSNSGMVELKKEKDDGEGMLNGSASAAENAQVVKANKGMILRKSVEYIRYLQQLVTVQGQRNRELEGELRKYRPDAPLPSSTSPCGGETQTNPIDLNLESFGVDVDADGEADGEDDSMDVVLGGGGGGISGSGVGNGSGNGVGGGGGGQGEGVLGQGSFQVHMHGTEEQGQQQNEKGGVKRRGSNAHKRKSSAGGRLPSMPEEEEPQSQSQLSQAQGQLGNMHPLHPGHQQQGGQQFGAQQQQKDVGMDVDGDQGMSPLSQSSEGSEGSVEQAQGMQRGRSGVRVQGGMGW